MMQESSLPSPSPPTGSQAGSWTATHAWVLVALILALQAAALIGIGLDFTIEAVLVLGLLFLGAWILKRPFLGLVLISLINLSVHFTFTEAYRARLFGFSWYLMDWPFLLMVVGTLLYAGAGGRLRLSNFRLPLPLFLLIGYAVFSTALGLVRGNEPRQIFYDLRPFFYYLTFPFVLLLVDSRERLRLLVTSWLVFSIAGSLWGIYLAATMAPELAYQGLGFFRIAGPSEATYGLIAVISLSLFPFVRGRLRLLILAQLFVSATALVFGYTRGSWLGLGVSLVFLVACLAATSPRRLLPLAHVAVVVAAVLFPGFLAIGVDPLGMLVSRVQAGLRWSSDLAILCRLVEYKVVWETWLEHPVLGTGLGHLFTFVQPLLGRGHWVYTHSSYLYVLSKMGAVGLGLFVIVLATFLLKALSSFARAEDDFLKGVSLGLATALVFLVVKSFSAWTLNDFLLSMFIGVLFGTVQWTSAEVSRECGETGTRQGTDGASGVTPEGSRGSR